ncbi:MAG: AAA family ATPase [Okeania sp. SIO3I5]|uniref:trifunctional serine/threonine-protein kinase/ATP-binding protein/sensor histidine kinase n=1 Tax=Okeania sp. SIO3I5 TaxID=2607805 RepID=UPI0013B9659E|nr:ATP-binding sensor histidine kinase [Okeania sp. SIO3I5]NEQ37502.1 AAA family ATPase [Okeania sp. SIO3I5]
MSKIKTIKIDNYYAQELIHKSDRTEVYRAQNVENGQPVIIKLMHNQYPSFTELVQFRNQYVISKNLDIEGIIKTYALQRYENRYALIMEDMGGISLAEYQARASLCLSQFLDIAIQLSEIIHQLHNNYIIHKDIKPANILIHPETKQVKLIDFSISTLLPKETQAATTPNVLEGTLAYLSPEQTGRMNRAVDYRSDFYSLGVTFYELLTGTLPFNSDDALELIHAHIAISPDPLSNSVVLGGDLCPPTLSDIVLKLMGKNAESRYQSALGLKYDLEKCRKQWLETGKIESFELGEQDRSDRFLIPEKLYGREKEVQALLDAFERVAHPPQTPLSKGGGRAEMILVAGFSGIGKTAVVNEVHKPIVKQRGYFIKGKFDQFNRNVPFSAFVQAFRSLMGQILSESDAELANWKTQILEALGNNGQVLIDVIPELEAVIDKQPPVPELSGSAAQNRFNLLFEKFIAVFTTKEHPLVIFLDDLQWADSASLNLMKVLMGNSTTGYLLLLGAYRDNEVFPAHPLILTLAELEKQEAAISTITLAPLFVHHINQLVAETLICQVEQSQPLTELVYRKTQGNPFFTTQLLKGLYEDKLILFNQNLGYWECDLVQVRDAALTDDVVEFMARRLQKLPAATQEVLKLAACIGNQFDLETLAVVCQTRAEEVASQLWSTLQEGMVLPISQAYKFFQGEINSAETERIDVNYRFLHDRVQQAAYALIPEEKKQIAHVQIGQLLLASISPDRLVDRIFAIVNHLNKGIDNSQTQKEPSELLRLNRIAGIRAKETTAYESAMDYLEIARQLLPTNSWQHCYEVTLEVYLNLAEVNYLSGKFATSLALVESIVQSTKQAIDRAEAFNLAVLQFTLQGEFLQALEYGKKALDCLNFDLLETNLKEKIESCQVQIDLKLGNRKIEQIVSEPEATVPDKRAIIKILNNLLVPTYVLQKEDLYFLITLSIVFISLNFGMVAESSYGFSSYGMYVGGKQGNYQLGYEFGQLAEKLAKRFHQGSDLCKACYILGNNILSWVRPLREAESIFNEGLVAGLESGELIFSANILMYKSLNPFYAGDNILEIQETLPQHLEFATRTLNYQLAVDVMLGLNIWLADITQNSSNNILTEQEYLKNCQANNSTYAICHYWILKTKILCLYGRYEEALIAAGAAEEIINVIPGKYQIAALNFYQSIAAIEYCRLHSLISNNDYLEKIKFNQAKLKQWAASCHENFSHKYFLVDATVNSFLGNKVHCIDLYDRAIAAAKENKYIQEEALANELAAKFYLDWGKEKFATLYLQEAYYCYAQWGAKAKIKDLELRYPQLLKPILESKRQSLSSKTSISKLTSHSHSQTATVANISSILDFSSLLKASQTLSGEIELDRLLSTILKIILENAGATKSALLLSSETGLTIEAIANRTGDSSKLTIDSLNQSIPWEDSQNLPVGLINYVRRTTETALLDAQAAQEQFAADNYLLRFHPQSLLCMPLQERGKLIGILYLENRLTADAFTTERLEILDTLCAQAAISLQNARLYQQAQQTLKDLQAAQLQLVQSEKMATLGNLVAGVAHEINNPVGFISGNVDAAQEHLQDLLSALSLYQENTSPPQEIVEAIEELETDFIAEDFPKLIASMAEGCQIIRNISTSLRTFSRTDTASKTEFNLHDGIDSTLLILKYRLKANENRPAIEIVKNYGNIPLVKCYAGQLNQVFMNLLANAIDALDESNEGKTFTDIEKKRNCITIATELSEDKKSAIVRIADNGTGIPEEVKARLFESGFTTKAVGKGTGLGMAIAHQIVTEKHGGMITCNSTVGQGTIFTIIIPR